MIPLPLALAVLLSADPVAEPPPPVEAERLAPTTPRPEEAAPPPAAPVPAPPGQAPPDEPPDLAHPGGATPPRTPRGTPATPLVREYAVQAGMSAVSLAGLGATGLDGRFALRAFPGLPGIALLSVEGFVGETDVGLQVRSLTLDGEAWIEPASRLRFGAGIGVGLVGYKRATNGEWPVMFAAGLRVGAEVAPLRWRNGAFVIGVHLAGHVEEEFWGSASLRVGLRFHGTAPPASPAPRPEADAVNAK